MGYNYGYGDALGALADYYIIASIFSLISTIAAIIVATIIAKKKGRSGGWGWRAVAIGWVAVIIVACLPKENNNTTNTTNTYSNTPYGNTSYGASWTCSNCNSVNDANYNYCSNCGSKKPE